MEELRREVTEIRQASRDMDEHIRALAKSINGLTVNIAEQNQILTAHKDLVSVQLKNLTTKVDKNERDISDLMRWRYWAMGIYAAVGGIMAVAGKTIISKIL